MEFCVGGGSSAQPHGRLAAPNPATNRVMSGFGNRVDCYAWVENVVTCGNPAAPTKVDGYWTAPPFGGTSAAAPIIAGVCHACAELVPNTQTRLSARQARSRPDECATS